MPRRAGAINLKELADSVDKLSFYITFVCDVDTLGIGILKGSDNCLLFAITEAGITLTICEAEDEAARGVL